MGLFFVLLASLPNEPTVKTISPFVDQVDINAADVDTLQFLPGVGPVLAQRIVDDRRANGPYDSVSDLQRVHGIGSKTVKALWPLIRFPTSEAIK